MNKKIIKMAIAALACVTICGTTMAAPAPRGGKGPAPAHQKAPAQKNAPAPKKAPAPKPGKANGHEVAHHGAPAHHPTPVRHPAPPPPPPPRVVHAEYHHEANGWAVLGAAVIGGIVGAIAH